MAVLGSNMNQYNEALDDVLKSLNEGIEFGRTVLSDRSIFQHIFMDYSKCENSVALLEHLRDEIQNMKKKE